MNEIDVTSEWAEWADCHSAEDQKKRLDSARAAACTPVLVDKENVFAYFQSDRGKYETFLDRCDCTDFKRRKRPKMFQRSSIKNFLSQQFDNIHIKIILVDFLVFAL